MSFSKALCVLCECPTADGAVLAVHVDKDKLQHWALNVCGHELAHEIDDEDQICYFCVWQAEFLARYDYVEESLIWWQNLEFDDAAILLKKKYFEGEVEQCWVQLEKIEMPREQKEEAGENSGNVGVMKKRWKCIYCISSFRYPRGLSGHIKKAHKNAIRCEKNNCATYFHTFEERNKHHVEAHKKLFKCEFCAKEFKRTSNYREHVRRVHKEFKVKCSFFSCPSLFKSETQMKTHFETIHKLGFELKTFECGDCGFKFKSKDTLERHVAAMHFPKTIRCEECHKFYATAYELNRHFRAFHTFKECPVCKLSVTLNRMRTYHSTLTKCQRCKREFACAGLYHEHRNACKEIQFKCQKCSKAFNIKSLLNYHMKRQHCNSERGGQYKNLGFKCDPCQTYYKSEKQLKKHILRQHNKGNWKQCAHCNKSFRDFVLLKHHLSTKHNLIEGTFECSKCDMKLTSLTARNNHVKHRHSRKENCKECGKFVRSSTMRRHLLLIHKCF